MDKTTNSNFKLKRGSFAWNVVTPTGVRYFRKRSIAEDCIKDLEKREQKLATSAG
jgi:hypothetical protein